MANKTQILGLFIFTNQLYVFLGDVFAHHQEHLTVFTASDIVHVCCCRPDTGRQQHTWTISEAGLYQSGDVRLDWSISWLSHCVCRQVGFTYLEMFYCKFRTNWFIIIIHILFYRIVLQDVLRQTLIYSPKITQYLPALVCNLTYSLLKICISNKHFIVQLIYTNYKILRL